MAPAAGGGGISRQKAGMGHPLTGGIGHIIWFSLQCIGHGLGQGLPSVPLPLGRQLPAGGQGIAGALAAGGGPGQSIWVAASHSGCSGQAYANGRIKARTNNIMAIFEMISMFGSVG